MMLIIHVGIALTSVAYVLFAYLRASRASLRLLGSLVGATLISGTALALMNPAHMPEACTAGILYVQGMLVAIVLVRRKMLRAREVAPEIARR